MVDYLNVTETVKDLCENHIKLIGYNKQAYRESKPNIARIFEALSFSKQVQALCILSKTGNFGSTKDNLLDLISSNLSPEIYINDELTQSIEEMLTRFEQIDEKNRHLFVLAKDSIDSESDLNIGNINICSKCGYALVGNITKECIICHSPSGYFRTF